MFAPDRIPHPLAFLAIMWAVMQLGHQGRQLAAADVARKMIQDGAIGDITLINVGRFFNNVPERPPWRWYGGFGNYERPDPKQVIRVRTSSRPISRP